MAFTDLEEHLAELFSNTAIFDKDYGSGRGRSAPDGYAVRRVPTHTRRHDDVRTDELAKPKTVFQLRDERRAERAARAGRFDAQPNRQKIPRLRILALAETDPEAARRDLEIARAARRAEPSQAQVLLSAHGSL